MATVAEMTASVAAERILSNAATKAEIKCPGCAEQPLSQEGDNPELLFCPHCEIEVRFNVKFAWRHRRAGSVRLAGHPYPLEADTTGKARLYAASGFLKDAADEFIEAHAKWAGGHRPVLWATYNDCNEAIVVCHKSWAEKICDLFGDKKEPVHVVEFPEGDPNK